MGSGQAFRLAQDKPFDASILLSIEPETINSEQGRWPQSRWVDSERSLKAADQKRYADFLIIIFH